jgi:hypothetical protein
MSVSDPTIEDLTAQLTAWRAAQTATAGGSQYALDGLQLTRADALVIKDKITELRREIINLEVAAAGGQQGVLVPTWS